MPWIEFLVFLFPFGTSILLAAASLAVLKALRFWGSWLMFISLFFMVLCLMSLVGLFCYEEFVGGLVPDNYFIGCLLGSALTFVTAAAGFFGVARRWVETMQSCELLEKETKALTAQRESAAPKIALEDKMGDDSLFGGEI